MSLERYKDFIPDWEKFCKVVATPQSPTIRVQTSRVAPAQLVERLQRQGFRLEALPFPPHFYRVAHAPYSIGKTLEHWLGLFYIQEAVAGIAACALGLEPGSLVLDLCAAPGGKTTQLCDLAGPGAVVISSDSDAKRLRALSGNVCRMGCLNAIVLQADGRTFPEGSAFDAVLVDAPCTAEGNVRQDSSVRGDPPARLRAHLASLQESLLRRAVRLVRPGGAVLYVTCTFAPEENEAVVSRVLGDAPVAIEPIELSIPHEPGWTRFGAAAFDSRLVDARRIYPYHLDSGGLFLARLRKTGHEGPKQTLPSVPAVLPDGKIDTAAAERRIERAHGFLSDHFGVSRETLQDLGWLVWGRHLAVHQCSRSPLETWRPGKHWRLLGCGFRALTPWKNAERPTSYFLSRLQEAIRQRRVALTPAEWEKLLSGQRVFRKGASEGFVALCLEDEILGSGLVRLHQSAEGGGSLQHLIGAERARTLRDVLSIRRGG